MSTLNEKLLFREDAGRRYQAQSKVYTLPADEIEALRLDGQHAALKTSQHGSNYLAPIRTALPNNPWRVGTSSNVIWLREMALELPKAEFMKKAGEIYAPVNHHSPDTARGFLKDKCGLTDEELDSTKEGFIGDIGREG